MAKKRLLYMFAIAPLAVAAVATFAANNDSLLYAKAGVTQCENHVGYHYLEKPAGYDTPGHAEFWVCCTCHEVFLEEPNKGTFTTRDDSLMIGTIDVNHPAYIAPGNSGGSNGDYWVRDDFED